jgi:hypothetical protein
MLGVGLMGTSLQRYTRDQFADAAVPASVDEAMRLGQIMGASGMFEGVKVEQAVAKVIAGRELGIGPMAAMRGVNIIKGKVSLSAELVATLIKRSGRYDFRADVADDHASVTIYDRGEALAPVTFTVDDAKRAKLIASDGNWVKYPGDMCFTKAVIRAARRHCPEVIGGAVYMDDGDDHAPPEPVDYEGSPGRLNAAAPVATAGPVEPSDGDPYPISEGQRKRLWAMFRESGHSEEWLRGVIHDLTGQDSTSGIPADRYDAVIAALEAGPAAEHEAAGGEQLPGMPPADPTDPDRGD